MLAYRTNTPEPPRPPKPPRPEDLEPWHPEDGLDWRPRALPLTTKPPLIETPVITTQAPQAATPESQMSAKANKKTPAARPGGPGVIASIIETIARDRGGSIEEIVAVLVKKFPDREENGMRKTALIQANRNCTSKERDQKRGLVYYRRGRK